VETGIIFLFLVLQKKKNGALQWSRVPVKYCFRMAIFCWGKKIRLTLICNWNM